MPHTHGTVNEVTRGSKAHQRRLMMTLTLTGTVFVAEIVGAIITGSLALLVDAGHMLTDMSVLIASTVTAVLMRRKPNSSRTWGWARLEVLTAEAGAMILLFVGLYALIEAGMRLFGGSAEHVADSGLLLFFGILGLAANVGSIIILAGQHNVQQYKLRPAYFKRLKQFFPALKPFSLKARMLQSINNQFPDSGIILYAVNHIFSASPSFR